MKNRTLVIVLLVLVGAYLWTRHQAGFPLPWNSSPRTVVGGHYGGGQ